MMELTAYHVSNMLESITGGLSINMEQKGNSENGIDTGGSQHRYYVWGEWFPESVVHLHRLQVCRR